MHIMGVSGPLMIHQRGGGAPLGAVFRAATVVKMQSNSQGTFWGSVEWKSSALALPRGSH